MWLAEERTGRPQKSLVRMAASGVRPWTSGFPTRASASSKTKPPSREGQKATATTAARAAARRARLWPREPRRPGERAERALGEPADVGDGVGEAEAGGEGAEAERQDPRQRRIA